MLAIKLDKPQNVFDGNYQEQRKEIKFLKKKERGLSINIITHYILVNYGHIYIFRLILLFIAL